MALSSCRWSSAVRGYHHFAYPRRTGRPHPSFPWKRPERRTRRTKRLIPTDHRLFQARVPQFADNVNSHSVSLMATHIRIQFAEGPKERLRGPAASPVASQVINHRTISRRLSVRRQCELPPSVARSWRLTPGTRPPKGRRKDSGVTATRLPGDESPDDIPKASSCQTQHGQQ